MSGVLDGRMIENDGVIGNLKKRLLLILGSISIFGGTEK
jgi:hypothetical protein